MLFKNVCLKHLRITILLWLIWQIQVSSVRTTDIGWVRLLSVDTYTVYKLTEEICLCSLRPTNSEPVFSHHKQLVEMTWNSIACLQKQQKSNCSMIFFSSTIRKMEILRFQVNKVVFLFTLDLFYFFGCLELQRVKNRTVSSHRMSQGRAKASTTCWLFPDLPLQTDKINGKYCSDGDLQWKTWNYSGVLMLLV